MPQSRFLCETKTQATVSVVGEASMKIAPNQVYFSLEIITVDKVVGQAKRANDVAAAKLLELTKSFGIADADVQTESVVVSPKYMYQKTPDGTRETAVVAGYEVKSRIQVTLNDLKRIDEFLSKAIAAGVNRVASVNVGHSELQKYQEQTRALAVNNAENKARKYAQQLGLTLGKAFMIREEEADQMGCQSGSGSGFGDGSGDGDGGAVARLENPPAAFDRMVAFALGQIQISEKILVAFDLKR